MPHATDWDQYEQDQCDEAATLKAELAEERFSESVVCRITGRQRFRAPTCEHCGRYFCWFKERFSEIETLAEQMAASEQ